MEKIPLFVCILSHRIFSRRIAGFSGKARPDRIGKNVNGAKKMR